MRTCRIFSTSENTPKQRAAVVFNRTLNLSNLNCKLRNENSTTRLRSPKNRPYDANTNTNKTRSGSMIL
ncbi:hypothetical protein BJY04DRAFT_202722 [Aspergillus karnatakaensis]|uniref:uncharacterized protein n=1 Tax=Aspergillus karnatakaensis TaxID=1810916 RepID=UPI003CCDFF0E